MSVTVVTVFRWLVVFCFYPLGNDFNIKIWTVPVVFVMILPATVCLNLFAKNICCRVLSPKQNVKYRCIYFAKVSLSFTNVFCFFCQFKDSFLWFNYTCSHMCAFVCARTVSAQTQTNCISQLQNIVAKTRGEYRCIHFVAVNKSVFAHVFMLFFC